MLGRPRFTLERYLLLFALLTFSTFYYIHHQLDDHGGGLAEKALKGEALALDEKVAQLKHLSEVDISNEPSRPSRSSLALKPSKVLGNTNVKMESSQPPKLKSIEDVSKYKLDKNALDQSHSNFNRKQLQLLERRCGSILSKLSDSCESKIVFLWDKYFHLILVQDMFSSLSASTYPLGEAIVMKSLLYGLDELQYIYLLIYDEDAFVFYYQHLSNVMLKVITNWEFQKHFFGTLPGVKDNIYKGGFSTEQYLIPYPVNYVNTFLGFIQHPCTASAEVKTNSGLLWGKEGKYFVESPTWPRSTYDLIEKKWPDLKLYATCKVSSALPPGVENLSTLSRDDFLKLLSRQKFFMSLGHPQDGPSALEALSCGVPLIHVVYSSDDVYERRKQIINSKGSKEEKSQLLFKRLSQHQYMEHFTKPLVYHIQEYNEPALMEALNEILSSPPIERFVPEEYTKEAYLERLKSILHRDWC